MNNINSAVQEMVRRGLRSMDHLNVLLSLRDANAAITVEDIARATRLGPSRVAGCLADLVNASLAEQDVKATAFTYSAAADDHVAVEALAVLHSQFPGVLAVLFEGPKPVISFSDAFRLRSDKDLP